MSNIKDIQGCDVICKNHSARTERDLYRICPSKLSKRELENLYFALLENNLDLKKTVHTQQEKIKVLSTKVQRMTVVQKNAAGKDRDCCSSKALVNEQKELIMELKKTNERMADRIRLLNMRLCSAKQFLKRSPSQTSKCFRCATAPASVKNASMSALNGNPSNASVKMTAVSSQYIISKDASQSLKETQTVEAEADLPEKDNSEKQCNENKCRTVADEMKQKIGNLEEELSKTHEEYASRISALENTVSGLQEENLRVRSNHVASEHALTQRGKSVAELKGRLRDSERTINDLRMQLTIEKRKVTELETSLKLAKMSSPAVETIERLSALNQDNPQGETVTRTISICSYCNAKQDTDVGTSPRVQIESPSLKSKHEVKLSKSDDSGYTDLNKSSETEEDKVMERMNQELLKRITDLQTQLDSLRIKSAGESSSRGKGKSKVFEKYDSANKDDDDVRLLNNSDVITKIVKDKHSIVIEFDDELDGKCTDPQMNKAKVTSTPNNITEFKTEKGNDGHGATSSQHWEEFFGANNNSIKSVNSAMLPSPNKGPNRILGEDLDELELPDPSQNKFQIPVPAPTPVVYSNKQKDKKNAFKNSKSKGSKKSTSEEKSVTIDGATIEGYTYDYEDSEASTSKNASNLLAKNNDFVAELDDTDYGSIKSGLEVRIKIGDPRHEIIGNANNYDLKDTSKIEFDIPSTVENKLMKDQRDSIAIARRKLSSNQMLGENLIEDKLKRESELVHNKPISTSNTSYGYVEPARGISVQSQERGSSGKMVISNGSQHAFLDTNSDEYELCASHATVCRCPKLKRRDVTVFRTCSGTLCFNTIAATDRLRHCDYCTNHASGNQEAQTEQLGTITQTTRRDSATETQPGRRDSATFTATVPQPVRRESVAYAPIAPQPTRPDSATFTATALPAARRDSATFTAMVPKPVRCDSATYTGVVGQPVSRDSGTFIKYNMAQEVHKRRTSSDNTEHEISSLSDLPPEKDVKSPLDTLSPGEERPTMTQTDTETGHTTDYGSLSEGELPSPTKHRKLSFGEKAPYSNTSGQPSSVQMEATLHAISEELSRCRQLLATTRSHEIDGSHCQIRERPEKLHKLHHATANRRLPDTQTHTCVFTLHIGTLVLSDEAVLNSRDKSLLLRWKFFDQNVTMARLRAGRVVLFDFSTEYDVPFSDEFLNYMKQEEMSLVICEVNNQNEPFATCSLPLRDALLHTNRRADMSLALTAGPGMTSGAGLDTLVTRDDLGVLDLWCILRVDAPLQHLIYRAICRSSTVSANKEDALVRSSSHITQQSGDDDPSQGRMSQDIAMPECPTPANGTRFDPKIWDTPPRLYSPPPGPKWSIDQATSTPPVKTSLTIDNLNPELQYPDISRKYHRSSTSQKSFSNSRHKSSGYIANEVPANIRSTDEMKQALERNVQVYQTPRFPKPDEEVSRTHSSLCSLTLARKKMQKIKTLKSGAIPPSPSPTKKAPDSLQDLLKKERKMSSDASAKLNTQHKPHVPLSETSRDDIDPAITKKYNNIGLSKIMEASKKTVSYDFEPKYTEQPVKQQSMEDNQEQSIDITVLWLALNEECEAMVNPNIHRLYVAYSFLGRRGAELETPVSLPKPKHYADKCYFNFKKTFNLHDADLPLLGHMSRCRAGRAVPDPRDCLVFSVVSEPPEDPLGLSSCEDIGHAYLYLGDILAYSAGSSGYTEVIPVRTAPGAGTGAVCGVLAVRVDGLHVLRRCLTLSHSARDLTHVPKF